MRFPRGNKIAPQIRRDGDLAYIPLSGGFEAVIDADDIPLVSGRFWTARRRAKSDGSTATHYAHSRSLKTTLHRVIMGADHGEIIDHINSDGLDNRRKNLRKVNKSQNGANSRMSENNTSGFKGVSPAQTGKWFVSIRLDCKTKYVGIYQDKIEAARAYDAAAVKAFGEFALTNEAMGLLQEGRS